MDLRLYDTLTKEKRPFTPPVVDDELVNRVKELAWDRLAEAMTTQDKKLRRDSLSALHLELRTLLCGEGQPWHGKIKDVDAAYSKIQKKWARGHTLSTRRRIDGRAPDEIRQITIETGVLPRAHGSALFTRGETQAMVVTTLGTGEDEQYIDSLSGTYKEQFLLHYNFPPYSVGETGRMGGTKRREIGHGKLAWRAIHPVLPPHHEFPYTVRVVSEITESNGSSSMATVCGTSLALMDAGVPLAKPVAGIAMGLIKEG